MADRPPSPVPALHVSPEEARQHRHIRRRAGFLRLWLAPLLRAIQRRGQRFPKASVAFSRERLLSPLLIRILLLNALPLALLAVTLLFLNQFQNSLLETDVNTLREQAHIYAGALGQSAVREAPKTAGHSLPGDDLMLDTALARRLLMSLTEPSPNAHARLFDPDGKLVADSRGLPHHVHGASDVQAVAPNDPIDADGAWHPRVTTCWRRSTTGCSRCCLWRRAAIYPLWIRQFRMLMALMMPSP